MVERVKKEDIDKKEDEDDWEDDWDGCEEEDRTSYKYKRFMEEYGDLPVEWDSDEKCFREVAA